MYLLNKDYNKYCLSICSNCWVNFNFYKFQIFVRANDEIEVHLPIAPQVEQVS